MEQLLTGAQLLGITIDGEKQFRFSRYYEILVEWNRWMNLTRITDKDAVTVLHFLDSLTASVALPTPSLAYQKILDIGTGPGFPGIPLKIAFPDIILHVIESSTKKVRFLRHATNELGLKDIEIHHERAETLAHQSGMRESFDAVLSRATSKLPILAELALPFLRKGGLLIAQKKGDIGEELDNLSTVLPYLGGGPPKIIEVDLPGLQDNRFLTVIPKIMDTPANYPRKPGVPGKRPLNKLLNAYHY